MASLSVELLKTPYFALIPPRQISFFLFGMEHFFPVAFLCAPFISFSSRNHPSCSRTTPICARGGGRRSKNGYRREKAKSIDLVPEKLPVIEAIWRGATIATSCKYQVRIQLRALINFILLIYSFSLSKVDFTFLKPT